MDGPNQGHKLILVHKVDGPNHVNNLYMSTTRTDPTTVKTQVHDVDG